MTKNKGRYRNRPLPCKNICRGRGLLAQGVNTYRKEYPMLIKSENNSYYLSCNNTMFEIDSDTLKDIINIISNLDFEEKKKPFFKLPFLDSRALEMTIMRLEIHKLAHIFKYYENDKEIQEHLFTGISKTTKKMVLEEINNITDVYMNYLYEVEDSIKRNEERGEIVIIVDDEIMENKITEFEKKLDLVDINEFLLIISVSEYLVLGFSRIIQKLDVHKETISNFFNLETSEYIDESRYSTDWMSTYEVLINLCEILDNYLVNRDKKVIYLYKNIYLININVKLIIEEREVKKILEDYESINREKNLYMSQDLYQKAILFAGEKHKNQKFPNTEIPYIVHLSNVAMEVIMAWSKHKNFDINTAVQIALLHDVLEDTDTTYEELEETFGNDVATGVLTLTKQTELPIYKNHQSIGHKRK